MVEFTDDRLVGLVSSVNFVYSFWGYLCHSIGIKLRNEILRWIILIYIHLALAIIVLATIAVEDTGATTEPEN
jgi:protein-S-isoprenylcysteine O-methyltransferase Ste14